MLLGFATHANVAATVLIGLDDSAASWPRPRSGARDRIECSRWPAAAAARARSGPRSRSSSGSSPSAVARRRNPRRSRRSTSALECGGSDALSGITANPALGIASDLLVAAGGTSILAETSELIGAEHLLARRAVTPEVADGCSP